MNSTTVLLLAMLQHAAVIQFFVFTF